MKNEHELKVRRRGWSASPTELWTAPIILDRYLDAKADGYEGTIERLDARLYELSNIVAKMLTKEQLITLLGCFYGYEVVNESD